MGNRCADHVTPLYPEKLALTSPTGGGRSVGIVRVRTKATEFSASDMEPVFVVFMEAIPLCCVPQFPAEFKERKSIKDTTQHQV